MAKRLDDQRYLEPIPGAIAWLRRSELPDEALHASEEGNGPHWARLYEVETNRPIYGDRQDGHRIFYHIDDISERERTSYGWQGRYGIPETIAAFENLGQASNSADSRPPRSLASWQARLAPTLESQDAQGRWTDGKQLRIHDAVRHLRLLCDALDDLGPAK